MSPKKKAKKFNWRTMIRSHARRIWLWSPQRREAIRSARVAPNTLKCASCSKKFPENPRDGSKKQYDVDHRIPATEPTSKILSFDDFFNRLFECPQSDLRVLCNECHDAKTAAENKVRRER